MCDPESDGQFMGQYAFLVRYPLATDGATPLTLHCNGAADRSTSVVWRATDLSSGASPGLVQLQVGDSLLLTAGSGRTGVLEIAVSGTNGQNYCTCGGLAGDRFAVRFTAPGEYQAVARINGQNEGAVTIQAIQVDFQGPIASQLAFRRQKSIVITGPAQDVTYSSGDDATLEVGVKETTAQGARLYLKPLQSGTPVLLVRFGSALIPIVTGHQVDEFMLRTQAVNVMPLLDTLPDGSLLVGSNIEMSPRVENLEVVVNVFRAGITFDDSGTSKTFNSSDFTYDAASGNYLMPFRLIVSTNFTGGVCHNIAVYQAGELVGGE